MPPPLIHCYLLSAQRTHQTALTPIEHLCPGASVDVPHGTTLTCTSAETPGESFNVAIEVVSGSGWAAMSFGVNFIVPLTERSNAETKFGK